MKKKSQKISIIGVTITGNMGGQAMLISAIQNISNVIDNVSFDLLSVYSEEDKQSRIVDLNIIPVNPIILIMFYLPISVMFSPLIKFNFIRSLLLNSNYFNSLLTSDLVIDLGGITFVDGRGLPLLLYNVACTLPGALLGTPTFKLSQATGPFENYLNKTLAKFTLCKCVRVVARGKKTFEHLNTLNLENTQMYYDTTFCLETDEDTKKKAHKILAQFNFSSTPVIISPSRVVELECESVGINFKSEMLKVLDALVEKGKNVLLLPHSLRRDKKSKNNDITLCQYLFENSKYKNRGVWILPIQEDSRVLREVIGSGDIFVGCRFHSIVSALSKSVPTITIAWSHKYKEMIEPFEIEEYVLNYNNFSSNDLLKYIEKVESNKQEIKNSLSRNLKEVKKSSSMNFDLIVNFLNEKSYAKQYASN